jgi:hypothetical protein
LQQRGISGTKLLAVEVGHHGDPQPVEGGGEPVGADNNLVYLDQILLGPAKQGA